MFTITAAKLDGGRYLYSKATDAGEYKSLIAGITGQDSRNYALPAEGLSF